MLRRRGYERAMALAGGIHGWQGQGYPLEGAEPHLLLKAT